MCISSNFFNIITLTDFNFHEKSKSLPPLHINECSLHKNSDDLEHLLKCANKVFDIVAVSEIRITRKTSLTSNIHLQNYSFEFNKNYLKI